jgi:hypothetical protein
MPDASQVRRLLRVFESIIIALQPHSADQAAKLQNYLERDGFKFEKGRLVISNPLARFQDLRAAAEDLSSADILRHVERIETAIDTDPALAVGSAKELLETTCKAILVARGVEIDKADDIPQLMRKTMKALNLLPDDIPEPARGVETIRRLLSNLSTAVTGLAEIRNLRHRAWAVRRRARTFDAARQARGWRSKHSRRFSLGNTRGTSLNAERRESTGSRLPRS